MGDLGGDGSFKLSELGTVARGRSRHRPRNDPSLYGGPYPFFQTGDVKAADLYLRDYSQTYNETGLAQSKLWQPGTLCITIAANIAETAILGIPGCFPDSIVGFVADPEKVDTRYIKYYIDTIKLNMQSASKGTTQDNLSVDKLLTFDFHVPPLAEQRQIADTLSAYDDLIENNSRRIAILEEMAQRIYREWFVHFRYPGHESVSLVESELGPIPEGWLVRGLFEIVDATYGFPFKSSMFNAVQEGMPVIRIRDIVRNQSETYTTQAAESKYEINNGDLLVGMDGTFYTSIWMGAPALLNQRVVRLVPKISMSSLNLKFLIGARIAELNDSIVGTTVAHLSDRDLRAIRVAVPPLELLHRATRLFEPLRQTQQVLTQQAVSLTALKRLNQAKLLVH